MAVLAATILTVVLVCLTTLYYYLKFWRSVATQRKRKLPGVEPEWLYGNLRNQKILQREVAIHEAFHKLQQTFGDVFTFWIGPSPTIVFSNIEHVQQVLSNRQVFDQASRITRNFKILFPFGLISLTGDDWKRHTRLILPMFRRAKVTPYLDTITTCFDRFIEKELSKHDGEIRTDLVVQCQNVFLDVIAMVALNYDLEKSAELGEENLRQAFNDFVLVANRFVLLSGIPSWLGKLILKSNRTFQRALRAVKSHTMRVIDDEEKRQQEEFISSTKPNTMIASLLASSQNESASGKPYLTHQELFDEVSMLMLAGFETTSTAMSWFIFFMSKYPEVQQKIKDELQEYNLIGEIPLTQAALDSLVYAECVTKELLRFAPIAGAISREATCDTMVGEIPIKKGDSISIATQNLHRDPRYWKIDPTKFIPERFLNEDKNPLTYAYMPFGGGHRACAGQELAFFELKVGIVRLMQRVTFEDPGTEADNSGGHVQRITCFPKNLAVRIRVNNPK